MAEQHTVKSEGSIRKLSILELLMEIVMKRALKGHPLDIKLYEKLANHIQPEIYCEREYGVILMPEPMSAEEWIKEQEAKNLERKPPPEYFGEDGL